MTLSENIKRAIADFTSIKQALTDKNIDIPNGTPTSEYGNLIAQINGKGIKPVASDYVQNGLIAEWVLEGDQNEVLTNPLFVTDDVLGWTVGKVIDKAISFYMKTDNLGGTGDSGITLQCLVNCSSFPSTGSAFLAVGENTTSNGAAFGLAADSTGKLKIAFVNGGMVSDFTMESDTWYHITAVYNHAAQSSALFVNGDPKALFSQYCNTLLLKRGAAIGTWVWSSSFPTASRTNQGNFRIANCCIYDRPLTNNEIAENYEVDKNRYGL